VTHYRRAPAVRSPTAPRGISPLLRTILGRTAWLPIRENIPRPRAEAQTRLSKATDLRLVLRLGVGRAMALEKGPDRGDRRPRLELFERENRSGLHARYLVERRCQRCL